MEHEIWCQDPNHEGECPFYTPGTWRHAAFCKTPTGHPGDCWEENNRALGIKPGPAMVIVNVATGEETEIW